MLKTVIPALLAAALTACGGGGSNGAPGINTISTAPTTPQIIQIGEIATTLSMVPSMVTARLDQSGSQFVVVAGWYIGGADAPPVKIYKINSDQSVVDVTVSVLGKEFAWSARQALIADFNGDGIDDIFFAGLTDVPPRPDNPSTAFISRPGQSHQQVSVPGLGWAHNATVVDFDLDGDLDVISNEGRVWANDGRGNFSNVTDAGFALGPVAAHSGGSGICAGDLLNNGTKQIVVTDGSGIIDNFILEYVNGRWIERAVLPTPILDRFNTNIMEEYSHDVSCIVGDFDGDGRQDIMIVSADNGPDTRTGVKPAGSVVQIYQNLGNMNFADVTAYTGIPYQSIHSSYSPMLIDFNHDGKLDIYLNNSSVSTTSANQIWINKGNFTFSQVRSADINAISVQALMLPIAINDNWNILFLDSSYRKIIVKLIATAWRIV